MILRFLKWLKDIRTQHKEWEHQEVNIPVPFGYIYTNNYTIQLIILIVILTLNYLLLLKDIQQNGF